MSASSLPSSSEQTLVIGGGAGALMPDSTPPDFLPVGTRLHEFEITGLIGEGGFGVVYLAHDHLLQRQVALKEYLPASLATRGSGHAVTLRSRRHAEVYEKGLQSFINEARLLARFDHPALVKVHRFWEANETAYLIMPYYEGPTLKTARQAMSGPPDEAWIRRILDPLLDALELVHGQGCLHRDISPDNILLQSDGRPVLLDFGAARLVIADVTQALTVILKPGYAPIEQYAEMPGSVRQGPWTDLYALGAVVRFMVTGQTPPLAIGRLVQDSLATLEVQANGRYSAALLKAVDRCLAVKGEDRPQSVTQMRALLGTQPNQLQQTAAAAPDNPGVGANPPKPRDFTWLRRKAWTGAAIAAVTGGWLLYADGTQPSHQAQTPPRQDVAAGMPAVADTPPTPPSAKAADAQLQAAWQATLMAASPGFRLTVSGVKNPLRVGRDSLGLELNSARGGWLYLLLWDKANGQISLIFPNEVDREHRLEAGQALRLPRPRWHYEADAPAGEWELLLLASESRRDFSALGLTPDGVMLSASAVKVEQTLADSDLGRPALAGVPDCAPASDCKVDYGAMALTLREIEGDSDRQP
ncbi:serine/threonine-protein kinase [Malikia sp.]|uniref:serine/threonine protein kinase n=1 Tax=Malikia sp. TaxID=2070706 RepID=UPI00261872AA|nr:serine/threonine-protein kinase [Malikia sp.]MDD2728815.1 serine/threonine-protein kinase [Malikia sp.]